MLAIARFIQWLAIGGAMALMLVALGTPWLLGVPYALLAAILAMCGAALLAVAIRTRSL